MLRPLRALSSCALGLYALSCSSMVLAQSYPAFGEVDFMYAQDPQRFKTLWETARSQTVRIAIIGDSQETNPTSHGFQYMPLLNHEMWKRYGNAPETPLMGCFVTGPSPAVKWLIAGKCATPGPMATRLSASQILPNVRPAAFSALGSGTFGQLTMLEQDATHVNATAAIPTNQAYFDTSGVVKARIFAATNASSGEVTYRARPNAVASASYSAPITTTGTLSLGLQSPTFAVKAGDTSALSLNGDRYLALEVFGTSDTQLTDIIGLRFFNESRPQGVVIDSFALGGYTAASFLKAHANAGAMFAALGFHAAVIHYGANEAGAISAAQFKTDTSALISRLRSWVGDPAFPIILVADVYQSRPSSEQLEVYDQYVGAQQEIAQADSNVMVINARRLTEDIGWNAANGQAGQYIEDGVHYTALGAQVLAAAVASAMVGEIRVRGCLNDPGSVTLQASMTVIAEVGGTSACSGHGQFTAAQALTLNQPALEIQLTNDFAPAAGDAFKLFNFANVSGSFGTLTLPTLVSGLSWDTRELETTGTIKVITTATPPPPPEPPEPPPPTPAAPTITFTAGANQVVTFPASLAPLSFSLTGSGALTVTAQSRDTTLLRNEGIEISPGCGTSTLNCTATLRAADGRTGASSVDVTVADALGNTAAATASFEIKPASVPDTGSGTTSPGTQTNVGTTGNRRGGGGGLDVWSLLALIGIIALRVPRPASWGVRNPLRIACPAVRKPPRNIFLRQG